MGTPLFCLSLSFPSLQTGKGAPVKGQGLGLFVLGSLKRCSWPQRHCRPPRGTVEGSLCQHHAQHCLCLVGRGRRKSWPHVSAEWAGPTAQLLVAFLPEIRSWLWWSCLGLCVCVSMWQGSAGTGSLLGLQRAELGLQAPHLMGENHQGQ